MAPTPFDWAAALADLPPDAQLGIGDLVNGILVRRFDSMAVDEYWTEFERLLRLDLRLTSVDDPEFSSLDFAIDDISPEGVPFFGYSEVPAPIGIALQRVDAYGERDRIVDFQRRFLLAVIRAIDPEAGGRTSSLGRLEAMGLTGDRFHSYDDW